MKRAENHFRWPLLCVFVLGILFIIPRRSTAQSQENSLYEKGIQAEQAGLWQKALQDWSVAANLPSAVPDPRIGLAFIALTTRRHLKAYYPLASHLYFWGFTTKDLSRFHKSIQEEINRIGPLAGEKAREEWTRELKKGNPAVEDSIRGFWIQNDPVPSTPENERLIEQ